MNQAQPSPQRPSVALVFGGRSGEHPISCVTASKVLGAIDRDRYDTVAVGITRAGEWRLVSDDPADWAIAPDGTFPQVEDTGIEVLLPDGAGGGELRLIQGGALVERRRVDVVFPLLHGPWGEDGTVQGALDLIDLPYVGAGVLGSATAMDKAAAKLRFLAAGLPVAPFIEVDARTWRPTPPTLDDAGARLGWPVFVKPSRAGSSLGVVRAEGPAALAAAVAEAGGLDPRVLIEAEIRGREIECGVLGGRNGSPPRAGAPGEIAVLRGHDFYDYAAKYSDPDAVALTCPADLPAGIVEGVRTMAVQTFQALALEGLARVDFFYCPGGVGGARSELIVNEVNTMPGLTQFSMFPRSWAAAGLAYPDLIDELIQLALARPTGLR